MDIQTEIGQIVKMFAGNKLDDLANLAFGIIASNAREGIRANLFLFCQLRYIVKCGPLCIGKKGARAVLLQRLGLTVSSRRN